MSEHKQSAEAWLDKMTGNHEFVADPDISKQGYTALMERCCDRCGKIKSLHWGSLSAREARHYGDMRAAEERERWERKIKYWERVVDETQEHWRKMAAKYTPAIERIVLLRNENARLRERLGDGMDGLTLEEADKEHEYQILYPWKDYVRRVVAMNQEHYRGHTQSVGGSCVYCGLVAEGERLLGEGHE